MQLKLRCEMQEFDGIDWSKVLLGQRLTARQSARKRALTLLLRALGTFVRGQLPSIKVGSDEVLFVKSMQRADYDKQWQMILNCCDSRKQVFDLSWPRALSLAPIRRWARFFRAYRYAKGSGSLLDRLLDSLLCLYYLEALHNFTDLRPKMVVFFSEMRPVENALVQWFNQRGVRTVTLQHGLYIDYGNQPTINRLNYEASCAQTFLAWGDETVELVKRFNPSVEAVVCGAPQISESVEEVEPPCVYVVFDADLNRDQNRILLSVGKDLGRAKDLEVVVGLHPRNQADLYDLAGVSFLPNGDAYSRCGYVLGHTTTQIIKLARLGKRVFKLRSAEPCNRLIPQQVMFESYSELMSRINSSTYPKAWANTHIRSIDSHSCDRYREFFLRK